MRNVMCSFILGIAAVCFSTSLHADVVTVTVNFEEYADQIGKDNSWGDLFPDNVGRKEGAVSSYGDPGNKTTFTSGGVTFYNYNYTDTVSGWNYSYWSGAGLSTRTDTTTANYLNDMASATGTANSGSVYGIMYGVSEMNLSYNDPSLPVIMFQPGVELVSMSISNTLYSDFSMRYGDGFVEEGGWMNLLIYGVDANGELKETVTQRLAWHDGEDYQTLNYWETIYFEEYDFSDVVSLRFAFDGTYNDWGLVYPTYFAFDDIVYRYNGPSAVPEPASILILVAGFGGLATCRRRSHA